jgi:hypothetical protein
MVIKHDLCKVFLTNEPRLQGPGSASIKYDIVTALLAASAHEARPKALALRLTLSSQHGLTGGLAILPSAKTTGQGVGCHQTHCKDCASACWAQLGSEKAAARGRVAQHRIGFKARLARLPYIELLSVPDFAAIMSEETAQTVVKRQDSIVPMRVKTVCSGARWHSLA